MQTEKNSKIDFSRRDNPEFSFSKFLSSFFENQRLTIRKNLTNRPLSFPTILSILPFLFGFSYFFAKKYPGQLTNYFFEKNLPGLGIPTEKLNLDTVQYVLRPNLKTLNLDKTDLQAICQENSLIFNKNIFEDSLGQKKLINQYKNNSSSLSKVQIEVLDQQNFQLTSTLLPNTALNFANLDELPAYLESLSNFLNSDENSDSYLLKVKNIYLIENNDLKLVNKKMHESSQNLRKNFNNLLFKPATNQFYNSDILFGVSRNQENVSKLTNFEGNKQNKFLVFQQEFEEFWNLFQSELRSLFINENLILSINKEAQKIKVESLYLHKLISKLEKDNSLLGEILSYLDKIELVDDVFQTRRMSGYRYPDMTSVEINRVLLQQRIPIFKGFFTQSIPYLRINVLGSILESTTYNFFLEPVPNFSLLTKTLNLKDFEKDKILYQGPGIILDKNMGFDWVIQPIENRDFKVQNKRQDLSFTENLEYESSFQKQKPTFVFETLSNSKKITLRFWFQRYLSAYTTFGNVNKNFFGVKESPEVLSSTSPTTTETEINPNAVEARLTYKNQYSHYPPLRGNNVTNLNDSLFYVDAELQVPFISSEAWKQYQQKVLNTDQKSKNIFCPIPFIQTRFPKIEENLSTNTQTNYQISLYDDIDYHFKKNGLQNGLSKEFSLATETNFQSLLENENFGNIFAAGIYKKLPTIFSSNSEARFLFQENWEPLSSQSWLIISQLGFAFSVFQILKALAQNYGRELLVYLLDLVAAVGFVDEQIKQEIEILMGQREKGFRIISQSRKNFSNIVGVKTLLPELSEIVWFLRNSAREFSLSKTLPRGILLIGPPGTGKTLLVQAVAGEANVPVLTLSGSSLVEPGESGAVKLEILFQEARRVAPCIVFIDEIDTLAQKREQVMQNPMGADDIVEVLTNPITSSETGANLGKLLLGSVQGKKSTFDPFSSSDSARTLETLVAQKAQAQQDLQKEQLHLLMQFLVELDGIQGRDGVIVIGATNRVEMLDPAVLRPGRFDRIIELGLPGYEKRIEILKFYSQQLGSDPTISWNYFAERTAGFTAADLASIMNVSSLKAILNNNFHTLETIEYGIDRIMTSESQTSTDSHLQKRKSTKIKDLLTSNSESLALNPLFPNVSLPTHFFESHRLAYYQAGKIICTSLLEFHPPIIVAHLWSRKTNLRSAKIAENLQNYFFRFARRAELEQRIIGSYAGKVAEILFLQKLSGVESFALKNQLFNVNLSTLGLDDLSFGQVLIKFLIEKWFLYSNQPLVKNLTQIADNRNLQELSEEKIAFLDQLCQNIESSPRPSGQFLPGPFEDSANENDKLTLTENRAAQHNFSIPWWQQQISSELEIVERNFAQWYRIYIPNPEENELNPDWYPPDEFYHRNQIQESVAASGQELNTQNRFALEWLEDMDVSDCSWNTLGKISEDYQTHSLVLQSFNKAFLLLDQHRELLDVIASKLLTEKILRHWDLLSLFEKYNLKYKSTEFSITPEEKTKTIDQKTILTSDWGHFSRRKTSKWIDFEFLPSSSIF